MSMIRKAYNGTRGVTLLLTVIIIGSIIVAAGISAAFMGQTEIVITGDADRANVARSIASACVEEAMHRLKTGTGYAGGTVVLGGNSCTVTVSGAGTSRTISATATSGAVSKTIAVTATLKQNAALTTRAWSVDSWAEVDPP